MKIAILQGTAFSAASSWLLHDVLHADTATFIAATLGAVFGVWFTYEPKREVKKSPWWILKASTSLGMLIAFVAVTSAWATNLIPLVWPEAKAVTLPVQAGVLAVGGLILLPRLGKPLTDAAARFLEGLWK